MRVKLFLLYGRCKVYIPSSIDMFLLMILGLVELFEDVSALFFHTTGLQTKTGINIKLK